MELKDLILRSSKRQQSCSAAQYSDSAWVPFVFSLIAPYRTAYCHLLISNANFSEPMDVSRSSGKDVAGRYRVLLMPNSKQSFPLQTLSTSVQSLNALDGDVTCHSLL